MSKLLRQFNYTVIEAMAWVSDYITEENHGCNYLPMP